MASMNPRQERILQLCKENEFVQVNDLLSTFSASPATIRRDLTALEESGLIRKFHGKIALETHALLSFKMRSSILEAEKQKIGRLAADLVREGESIILDTGTTVAMMAERLRAYQHLSVVTNSLAVANILENTSVRVFMCGGTLDDRGLIDDDAVAYIAARRVDKAFIGGTGILPEGLTGVSPFHQAIKRQMVKSANEVYALLDSSKFKTTGLTISVKFSDLTGIVTSGPIENQQILGALEQHGVKVIYDEK